MITDPNVQKALELTALGFHNPKLDKQELFALYNDVFRTDICPTCPGEKQRVYNELRVWANKNSNQPLTPTTMSQSQQKFRFKKEFQDAEISLPGRKTTINRKNFTDADVELINKKFPQFSHNFEKVEAGKTNEKTSDEEGSKPARNTGKGKNAEAKDEAGKSGDAEAGKTNEKTSDEEGK